MGSCFLLLHFRWLPFPFTPIQASPLKVSLPLACCLSSGLLRLIFFSFFCITLDQLAPQTPSPLPAGRAPRGSSSFSASPESFSVWWCATTDTGPAARIQHKDFQASALNHPTAFNVSKCYALSALLGIFLTNISFHTREPPFLMTLCVPEYLIPFCFFNHHSP